MIPDILGVFIFLNFMNEKITCSFTHKKQVLNALRNVKVINKSACNINNVTTLLEIYKFQTKKVTNITENYMEFTILHKFIL